MDIEFIDDEDDIDIETSIQYINQIIEKIKSGDDADIENCGLRPIRELLQNADDAQATFMVFRFDKDRLWVYNNGASMKIDFLLALSTLGGASKKEVADTSGSFGTGFRATHMFTDTPEIEWVSYIQSKNSFRVNAKHMTLELEKWKDIENRKNLPKTAYMKLSANPNPDKLGVFFSFPWRIQNTTGLDDFGEYLWPSSRICELAKELSERIGPMLFGCRYLKNIRIVLTCGDDSTENFVFDASNSFSINDIKQSGDDKGKLALSSGYLANAQEMYALNSTGAWDRGDHSWYLHPSLNRVENVTIMDYYWAQRPVFSGKDALLDDAGNIELLSKRYWNMCILLLPLSRNAPCLPKYTPIPLGGLTDEKIGIVTFCPPAENRREIDTASPKTKKVIENITLSAIALYGDHIETALGEVSSSETMSSEEKEATLIALLPHSPPTKWLVENSAIEEGTFGENNSSLLLWEALDRAVQRQNLACVDGEMLRLSETVHTIPESGGVLDERIGKILSSTNQAVLGQIWSEYYRTVSAAPGNAFRELVWTTFLWYQRSDFHGSRAVHFIDNFLEIVNNNIGSLQDNDLALTRLHKSMIELAILPPSNWQGERLQDLHLIRDGNGHLLTVTEAIENNRVVIIPPKFAMYESYLHTIIGKSLTLAQNLNSETIKALNSIEKNDSLRLDSKKIIQLIDQSTQIHPLKHQDLGKHTDFHEAVSQLTVAAVKGGLSRSDIRGLRFLPVSRNGIIQTQEENTLMNGQLIWGVDSEVSFSTKSQGYHRDFVFPKLEDGIYSTMPNYLKQRLRFLSLTPSISKDDVNQIINHFIFNQAVNPQGEPLNLIRTLLTRGGSNNSNRHLVTESVFHPSTQFLWQPQHVAFGSTGLQLPSLNEEEIFKQKLDLLIWLLKPYEKVPSTFGHKKISDVPYLPTHDGKWITPGDASTCTDKELLELIGRSSSGLHPDLVASLHTNVLKGLGVSGAITIEQARDILHDVQAGRNTNRGLMINLLRHFFEFFDCKNESDKDLYAEFSNQPGPWVPVGSKDSASLRAANEAYWPNEEYASFLGMHILDPETIPEEISDSRVKELQKFFGFATKLRTEDVLQLLDAERPPQLADEVDFEALQKYIAKNGFTTEVASSDLPEAMLIMDNDGQEHQVPKDAILATVAKKRAYGKMLTSAEAIPVFAHNEFSGGKKFCERLIEIGFCKAAPSEDDLIKELKNSTIEAGACSAIWTFIGKMEENQALMLMRFDNESLRYPVDGIVYPQECIAINNGTENPLLDEGGIECVLDAKKLKPNALKVMEFYDFQDFREILPEDVLAKATEAGPYEIPVEDFNRVKRLVLNSENQLFGILRGVGQTFRLVNVDSLNDYIMVDQHKDLRYSILNTEKWLIHPLDDAGHESRVAEHAVLFSQTNPEINPFLEDLTSTPNTAMGEAISTYLLGEDSNLEWNESQQRRFISESLNVEMVQGSIPRILSYRIEGQKKRVKLGGQAYCEKISEDGIDLYLSRDRQQCGPAEVARLVEACLLSTSVQPPSRFRGQLASYLANPQDGRDLFESNQARETAQALVNAYSGCQVGSCRRITPYAENTTMTSEKRKAFIGKKDTFYKWNQSVNPNYPLGQNIWLCPRHHTLWERGLIKFEGLEKNTVDECREVLEDLTTLSRTFDGDQIGIKIYDGKGREFNSKWEDDVLEVEVINGSNHGKEIYASLLDWVKKRLDQ